MPAAKPVLGLMVKVVVPDVARFVLKPVLSSVKLSALAPVRVTSREARAPVPVLVMQQKFYRPV